MARIQLKLYASLRPYKAHLQPDSTIELSAGATVRDLARQLGIPDHMIYTIIVNGEQREAETQLKDGDQVALFPPMGGGSAEATIGASRLLHARNQRFPPLRSLWSLWPRLTRDRRRRQP